MYICIDIEILVTHGIEHTQGFLGSGAIVEIDQRFAIYLSRQDGEVLSYIIYIIHKASS